MYHVTADEDAQLGLDMAVHGETATAIEGIVNEMANNFQHSFFGERVPPDLQSLAPWDYCDTPIPKPLYAS